MIVGEIKKKNVDNVHRSTVNKLVRIMSIHD